MLLFFVHLRLQQKRTESHLKLSNLHCCHYDIVHTRLVQFAPHGKVCA